MERQFQINWAIIVEEARQRRKAQRLTQQKLARLAGVSAPTVSRFENGDKNIQISSIMAILKVLGMVDLRRLEFEYPLKVSHDFDNDLIRFSGSDGERTRHCAISREALNDHFHGMDKDLKKLFFKHRDRILHEARRKYYANRLEPDESILIRTTDLT